VLGCGTGHQSRQGCGGKDLESHGGVGGATSRFPGALLEEVIIANDRNLPEECGEGRRTATDTPLAWLGLMILVDAVDMTLEKGSEENSTRRQERVTEQKFQLEG